jgi:transcriptional regulator with XRE-family HTH domain
MEDGNMTFGEKLKQARNEMGYSQEQLAETLAVSRSAIAKWETDKGMPDINNLKAISQILNVSIEYLLDDGATLDLSVVRKTIHLADYTDKKVTILNKKRIKDKVVRSLYPEAEIYTLLAKELLTKGEKAVDTAVWLLTSLPPGTIDLANSFKNVDKEYYLVNEDNRQYLVLVTEEYAESRLLAQRIDEDEFVIGNLKFVKCK